MPAHSHHKVVVITGASAGVGRATARTFARRGAHIGLLARSRERLEATRREVEAAGGRALALPTDVADHSKPTNLATLAGRTTCGSLFPATLARVASLMIALATIAGN